MNGPVLDGGACTREAFAHGTVRRGAATARFSVTQRGARALLVRRLGRLAWGRIELHDALGTLAFGGADGADAHVRIDVRDPRLYVDVALRGSVGAGEAFVAGRWNCDDLPLLARIFARNRDALNGLESGFARFGAAALGWWHARRDNTRSGSRANIAAHYDLGNEFYALFLDPTRMYSCAWFARPEMTLEEAQLARLDRICAKLELGPQDHLLEIGTGWGGLAIHAARTRGCRVTTATISHAQHIGATERVAAAGLAHLVDVRLEDYRDLRGRFDKLVSIEMVEAVGERWLDTYFERCSALLAPHGQMLLQAITIRDQHYEQALRSVDFIQRHVFPGSFIPSVSALTERVARRTDCTVAHLEDIGPHYARTLREWRTRFLARREEVRALGYDEEFLRLWEYYLAYCEGGFEERALGDVQLLLTKPLCRRAPFTE
jgi:cyclopropane-fatty-acyl-phospholipid synthase